MYSKETYATLRRNSVVERKNAMRRIGADYVLGKKINRPCADCKQIFPHYVMDFDHVVGTKKFNVSQTREYTSIKRIQSELDKCELVCANCHRIRTWDRKRALDK